VAINYGVLQTAIESHGIDSPVVAAMCELLGTTLEAAQTRITNSAGKIERDRVKKLNLKLAESMSTHLDENLKIGDTIKSARDWAIIAYDRLEKAKSLRAEAKPITKALNEFRIGKLAELVSKGKAKEGTAFSFKVETDKLGNRIVSWAPKGTRGSGGGRANGTLIGALDGTIMSWTAIYTQVIGVAYAGANSHSKQLVTDAPDDFDFSRITYNPAEGAESAIQKLSQAGAIAVEGLAD